MTTSVLVTKIISTKNLCQLFRTYFFSRIGEIREESRTFRQNLSKIIALYLLVLMVNLISQYPHDPKNNHDLIFIFRFTLMF